MTALTLGFCLMMSGEHGGAARGGEHPRKTRRPNLCHDGQGEEPDNRYQLAPGSQPIRALGAGLRRLQLREHVGHFHYSDEKLNDLFTVVLCSTLK